MIKLLSTNIGSEFIYLSSGLGHHIGVLYHQAISANDKGDISRDNVGTIQHVYCGNMAQDYTMSIIISRWRSLEGRLFLSSSSSSLYPRARRSLVYPFAIHHVPACPQLDTQRSVTATLSGTDVGLSAHEDISLYLGL